MYPLMPLPAQIESGPGTLVIDSEFRVGLSGQVEPRLERAAARLTEHLSRVTGIPISRYLAADRQSAPREHQNHPPHTGSTTRSFRFLSMRRIP